MVFKSPEGNGLSKPAIVERQRLPLGRLVRGDNGQLGREIVPISIVVPEVPGPQLRGVSGGSDKEGHNRMWRKLKYGGAGQIQGINYGDIKRGSSE